MNVPADINPIVIVSPILPTFQVIVIHPKNARLLTMVIVKHPSPKPVAMINPPSQKPGPPIVVNRPMNIVNPLAPLNRPVNIVNLLVLPKPVTLARRLVRHQLLNRSLFIKSSSQVP